MSHITTIQVQVKDIEALKAACARLGVEFREGQRAFDWYGRAPQACEHAIHVPGARYEIGVVREGDHYALHWDDYSEGGLMAVLGEKGQRLSQSYAVEAAKAEAARMGSSSWEESMADGSVRLHVQVG